MPGGLRGPKKDSLTMGNPSTLCTGLILALMHWAALTGSARDAEII